MRRLLQLCLTMVALSLLTGAAHANRWGRDYIPNHTVFTQDGKAVKFYDDLIRGKIVLVNFVYTSCNEVCPLITARLADVADLLKDRLGKDIFFISITVDPERDSPTVLKRYADSFRTPEGWSFVTGQPDQLREIAWKLGQRGKMLSDHQNDVMLGNDTTGEWGRDSIFTDIPQLAEEIRRMDPAHRDIVRPTAATVRSAGIPDANMPGAALFNKMCSNCHTIGGGDKIGPDLQGISLRRSKEWIAAFIRSPADVIKSGDAIALALVAKYNGMRMPMLSLYDNDIKDVMAYIEARSYVAGGAASGEFAKPTRETAGHSHH